MKKILPVLLAASMCFGSAQQAAAADLLGVYRDAIGYDAQFASAKAALDAGREKLPQGRAGLMPTIGFSASTTWNDFNTTTRSTPPAEFLRKYNSNGWTVNLSQPLFRWQNWAGYKQSELLVAQAEMQYSQAKQDLIVRVAQAYFDVLLSQESLASAQAQKAAISEQLASAKRNFEVGTATITDTNEAQARYDLTTAQEIAADNDLQVKRQTLATIIGREPGTLKNLRRGLQIGRPQPDDIFKWVESAEQGSIAVQLSQAGLEIASREIDKQRAGHYPTLDLVASRGRNTATAGTLTAGSGADSDVTTVGLQLAIPIFAGGTTVSRDREAVALREKASADLDNARRSAALAARQAYLGVTSGLAQVKALEQAVVSSQSALDSNKLGYEVGVRINIDVLNAQQQLYSTRRDLAKARLDTLAAQLKLKAAAGTLGEDDVAAVNALLE
ncbi:MAG: TolC family outer membrane protein [Betaproteobacteria bacterium]|nr:TolC family outer membrane protein [Betaproteobacteria bacterium]